MVDSQTHAHEDESHSGVEAIQGGEQADGLAQSLPRLFVEYQNGWITSRYACCVQEKKHIYVYV